MKRTPSLAGAVRGLALAGLVAGAVPATAHQCIDVEILRAPQRAAAGSVIHAKGAVTNCGEPTRGFLLTWALVSEDKGVREVLRRTHVELQPDERHHGTVRLRLPADLEAGRYALVFIGRTPNGFVDRDRRRIRIVVPNDRARDGTDRASDDENDSATD